MHIPEWAIKRYQEIVKEFIWDKKLPKISYAVLTNDIKDGGQKLQDLKSKIAASKLMWIKKIEDETLNSPWKAYLQTFFKYPLKEFPGYNLNRKHCPEIEDQFYQELVAT
jgi:hypothetical protein